MTLWVYFLNKWNNKTYKKQNDTKNANSVKQYEIVGVVAYRWSTDEPIQIQKYSVGASCFVQNIIIILYTEETI